MSEPERLVPIGRVGRPHGTDGAFVVERWTKAAGGRLAGEVERPVWLIPVSGGGLIDGEALPVIEAIPEGGAYDFEARYEIGRTAFVPFTEPLAARVQGIAVATWHALGCDGFARVDRTPSTSSPSPCSDASRPSSATSAQRRPCTTCSSRTPGCGSSMGSPPSAGARSISSWPGWLSSSAMATRRRATSMLPGPR